MKPRKTIIFLGDGMADEPLPELGNLTPLEYAFTPGMDYIASKGACGTLLTLPPGFPTSSEVANMSILGCDLEKEYCGRGPLEALAKNIEVTPIDVIFRLNLVTLENGILKDYSAGHISDQEAQKAIEVLNKVFGSDKVKFISGVSYRAILMLRGEEFSHEIMMDKPDDNHGEHISRHLPVPVNHNAIKTAEFLKTIMLESESILRPYGFNNGKLTGVWPWSGGRISSFKSLESRFNVKGAVISAVGVIRGLGRLLGMEILNVPGITGYIDTNYEGKARAAVEALKSFDMVYLHVEAIDEVSHERNLNMKIKAIEDFDKRVISPIISEIGWSVNLVVLPDHPVLVRTGKHTRTPVPVAVYSDTVKPDHINVFSERLALQGGIGFLEKDGLMRLFFGPPRI